ncbi:hypothetical protein BZA05DRAFT_446622 [Tricharina praecox]|uniref:uncharacterized protein n=1 Tax=Tricharina praecox TaxID=43433 RepID=UPI00221FEFDE|nr:uncharacterized protein BZA05DRAFT_446622 [Tricharina praecox]KAI5848330.1 hypothetical protein BZA05DRAFT_446622 [Tricharina praecox]
MSSDRSYALEVAVQPPTVAQVGVPLYPPLVIRMHVRDGDGNETSGEDELGGLFAHAALYNESGNPPSLAPPDMFLLSGRLSQSLDLLNESGSSSSSGDYSLSQQQGSYAIFPDLTINRPGRYVLGVSLFKVDGGRTIWSASAVANGGGGGGTNLEEAKTDMIVVQEGAVATHIEDEDEDEEEIGL